MTDADQPSTDAGSEDEGDVHQAHLRSVPSSEGLRRVAGVLATRFGPGAVRDVVRLGGGLDCATHALRYGDRRFVVKRSPPGAATALQEHDRLVRARGVSVPTPEPVAVDPDGEWFGAPSVVMSFVDGRPNLFPDDEDLWLGELARGLAAIHDAPVGDDLAEVAPSWDGWRPWTSAEADPLVPAITAAIDALRSSVGDEPTVFSHDDYHPGNVVWRGDRLAGVVDWLHASRAPRQAAVAYCRKDLAIHPGGGAPDRFLAAYEAEAGVRLERLPLWDVLYGALALRWGHRWVPSFAELGVRRTAEDIRRASAGFVEAALRGVKGPTERRVTRQPGWSRWS